MSNAAEGIPQGTAIYDPGTLKLAQTYYWRVDEFDIIDTHKGDVWSFTTQGAVLSLKPSNGDVNVKQNQILSWSPGDHAASHEVYFGTDKEVVRDADTSSLEYKGTKDLGSESYDPGMLEWDTTYYWRVDEVNTTNPDSPWIGPVWSFTTANFLIVDDFEDYNDYEPYTVYFAWSDGYENPANGLIVGYPNPDFLNDEHFVETAIVHGGEQAMPLFYSNTTGAAYSEAERTFAVPQNWTKAGIQTLVLYFHGSAGNTGQLYVKVNGSKVIYDGDAADIQRVRWKQWNIDLASLGVDLQNVTTISMGIDGNGASGTLYFDDVRLYASAPEIVVQSEEI